MVNDEVKDDDYTTRTTTMKTTTMIMSMMEMMTMDDDMQFCLWCITWYFESEITLESVRSFPTLYIAFPPIVEAPALDQDFSLSNCIKTNIYVQHYFQIAMIRSDPRALHGPGGDQVSVGYITWIVEEMVI